MLSVEDIYRELGKNIFIYPLNKNAFKDNSVDLTASRFAWSYENEIPVYLFNEEKKCIEVPPHTTAHVLTNEAVFVGNNIGGTYHSRVSLVFMGFGHIGTMLDPLYCGQSLIMLHNNTDRIQSIPLNEGIVSVVFYYLKTPIGASTLSTPSTHINKVAKLDDVDHKYHQWKTQNPWVSNPELLKRKFKEEYSEEVKHIKNEYTQKKNLFEKIISSNLMRKGLKYIIFIVLVIILVFVLAKATSLSSENWVAIAVAIGTSLISFIVSDLSQANRKQ